LLSDLVNTTVTQFDGIFFDECGSCPHCEGVLSGYDVKKKQFAIVIEKDQKRVVSVLVKRFRCHRCGLVSLANQPFYPDTRIGSPVVDLCTTLGNIMPYYRVSSCLEEMGLVVDRWSVRNYVRKNRYTIPSIDMFGFMIPFSIVSLSSLAVGFPVGHRIDASVLLRACNYPSSGKNPQ